MGGLNEADEVKRHLPWVRKLASRYARAKDGALFDDLVQEGSIAVLRAMRTWRPDGGASLVTYAWQKVRQRMVRRMIRSSVVCRSISDAEKKKVGEAPRIASMDAMHGEDGQTLHDHVDFSTPADQEDACSGEERAAAVRKVMATLPDRDAAIVMAVMEGNDYRTIAHDLGISTGLVGMVMKKWTPALRKRLTRELADVA